MNDTYLMLDTLAGSAIVILSGKGTASECYLGMNAPARLRSLASMHSDSSGDVLRWVENVAYSGDRPMTHLHLFSSGVTTLVVDVLARDAAGQATCRIVRCLYPPGRKGPAFWRAQHDQPGPGAQIVIPFSALRPCAFNVNLRAPHRRPRPLLDALVVLSLGFLVGAVMLFCLSGPAQRQVDAQTIRELARMETGAPDYFDSDPVK